LPDDAAFARLFSGLIHGEVHGCSSGGNVPETWGRIKAVVAPPPASGLNHGDEIRRRDGIGPPC